MDFLIRHSDPLVCAIELLIDTRILKGGIGRTLQAIAQHWNRNGDIYPSQERLASIAGVDRRTIVTHVKKLVELRIISTKSRKPKVINGIPRKSTLCYTFNTRVLGALYAKAKKVKLPEALQAKYTKQAPAATSQKDHLAPQKNDHINQNLQFHQQTENTVGKKRQLGLFNLLKKAFSSERLHFEKLRQQSAYKAGVKRNQIARGERFSDEELERRRRIAERNRPFIEAANKLVERRTELETAVITWSVTKTGFTAEMAAELKQPDNYSRIGIPARLWLDKFLAQ